MQSSTKMTPQQRKRLDRQRFIGLQTQKKLLNSRILITPVNGPNTQLAKNLVLAGVNVSIYDDATIKQDDFETNFLIGLDDIGKKRGQIVFNRLQQMNPCAINQFISEDLNINCLHESFFEKFTIICTSFNDFSTVQKWDMMTKKINKPYYNIFSVGLHSFAFVSLGSSYVYKQPVSKKQPKQFNICCLSLKQCLDKSQVSRSKKKQLQLLQAIIMMSQSQKTGLYYDLMNPLKMHEQMLQCMVQLGQSIKQTDNRDFLVQFARLYGVQYCPVYSVIGSIVSQQIIKVVENQQEPAMNWIIMNSQEGYACVLKLRNQEQRIKGKALQIVNQ